LAARRRILVTNATDNAGLSVIRDLALAGHELIGAAMTPLPFGLRSRHVRTVHKLPPAQNPGFDQSLVELVRATRPEVFLPLGVTSVSAACRREAELRGLTAMLVPSHAAYLTASDHAVCAAECVRLGIPCPASYSLAEACRRLADGAEAGPLVVKPRTDVGAANGVSYVSQSTALRQSVAECTARFGDALIQEFVPGDTSHMRTVVLLFDAHSELVAAFTSRKLRQWPPTGGLTVLSVSTAEAQLVGLVLPFFQTWRWRGFAEVELKVDARDGVAKVIEINPRVPAYLCFLVACGLPLGRLAAALARQEATAPLPFPSYSVGKKFVNPRLFLRSVGAELRARPSRAGTLGRALADLRGTGHLFHGTLTDPGWLLGRALLAAKLALAPDPP
jgi:predicted ATP-grasp superfamily ATP-dependent carboligase